MSNLHVNIRFGAYRFQLTRQWKIRIRKGVSSSKSYVKFFEVYEFFGYK